MKILVVDDEKELRKVVQKYLEKDGFETIGAANGIDAVKLFHDEKPDLVILDLMLPDIPGEKVCSVIRESHSTPVIMLSAKNSEEDRIKGLGIGADDYVVKPFSPRELVMRVKAVLRRTVGNSAKKNIPGELIIDESAYSVKRSGVEIELTPIEFKILSIMSKNPGRTYTREQLISYALGYEYEGMSRTIDSHIKNLRQKIEKDPSRPEYVRTVFGVGYKFKESQ